MKWVFIAILFLFVSSIFGTRVHAVEDVAKESLSNVTAGEAQLAAAAGNKPSLEAPLLLPGSIRSFVNTLFDFMPEEQISFHLLILLLVVWGVIVLVLQQVFTVIPFLSKTWQSLAAAAIITSIASVSGSVKMAALYLQGIGQGVAFLRTWGILRLALIVIALVFAYYLVSRSVRAFQRSAEISEAEQIGFNAGFDRKRR